MSDNETNLFSVFLIIFNNLNRLGYVSKILLKVKGDVSGMECPVGHPVG